MAFTMAETIGDTAPCPTCGHVKAPEKRLHKIACCGLESHAVMFALDLWSMTYRLAHGWREDGDTDTYSAVQSHREIGEADALAWLERAHSGEVERRPHRMGEMLEFDRWSD